MQKYREESTYQQVGNAFVRLVRIVDELRVECPWDREQTMESLRSMTFEEVYELADAIQDNDMPSVSEELGDLLLHMVFYARIGWEQKAFDIGKVLHGICDKLIKRHPHVYGEVEAKDAQAVKANWEQIKLKAGKKSVLSGLPRSLPPLSKAMRIQHKVQQVGFDWERPAQVWEKVKEELVEFEAEQQQQHNRQKTEEEFGDLLFALVNYARHAGIDPERALSATNRKFVKRFQAVEEAVKASGSSINGTPPDKLERFWENAKTQA